MGEEKKTWVTEINAVMAGIVALLLAFGVAIPDGVVPAVVTLINVALRIATKKGWI
jgi:hypothetical protein